MVKWSAPAKRDLKQIHDYIVKDSKYYAKKVAQNIVAATEELDKFPKIGRIVPEIGDTNVRELLKKAKGSHPHSSRIKKHNHIKK